MNIQKKDLIMLLDSWKASVNRILSNYKASDSAIQKTTEDTLSLKEKDTDDRYSITLKKGRVILFDHEVVFDKEDEDRENKKFVAVKQLLYAMLTSGMIHSETMIRLINNPERIEQ
jgi:hypothetical protein